MVTRVVVEPTCEPVSLANVKEYCKVDSDDSSHDTLLNLLIKATRKHAEKRTGRALILQTIETSFPSFYHEFELPRGPVQWIESIKYTNDDGAESTVDSSVYQLDSVSVPALVKPAYGQYWPGDIRTTDYNAVRVRYAAGSTVGAGSPTTETELRENVPEELQLWMYARISDLFDKRGTYVTGTIVSELPKSHIDGLLMPYKINLFK